jgi:hypothetical protein
MNQTKLKSKWIDETWYKPTNVTSLGTIIYRQTGTTKLLGGF